MTFIEFTTGFLNNLILETNQELDRLNEVNGRAIYKKKLNALLYYIKTNYLDGTKLSEDEFSMYLCENSINRNAFNDFVEEQCFTPFKKRTAEQFEEISNLLSKVPAINKKDLLEKIEATGNEKAFQFVVDCFKLKKLDYDFESFRDKDLETLYSNDDITFKVQKHVTSFFRFFIDGDAEKSNKYDPEKYYGCIPVSEKRIIAYCKQKSIPQDYIDKLLAIAKCSDRFVVTEDGKLTLKKQYLLNIYSISAAILFEYGKPLHKETLCERINKLHDQYPILVDECRLESFVLRRKPILCSVGGQGEWGLQIWKKDDRDVLTVIREFVADTFAKTQEPVHIDQIVEHILSIGFSYDKKSIKTYVTKAGCKGTGKNTYYPAESDFNAVGRYWNKKTFILQREAAEYILKNGPSNRKDIFKHITEKFGQSVNYMTLEKALFKSTELFLKEGKLKDQRIKLSDKLTSKKAIKIAFPEPSKQEPEYLVEIRCKMVEYLKKEGKALQTDLVDRFKENMPDYLKEKGGPIRKLLSDKNVFVKTKIGDKQTLVTLNPQFLEKMQLEAPTITVPSSPVVEQRFSWDALKEGVIRQMAEKEYDETLPKYVDNLFLIVKGGYDIFLPNSNFKGLIMQLYKYETAETSQEERKSLRKDMLLMMEAYFDEFYRLQYGKNLKELIVEKGLKARVDYLRAFDILPDKYKKQLDNYEWTVYCATNNVWYQRNVVAAHPEAFDTQKDIQSIKDIHDCLVVMLHLAKQLTKK